MPLEVHKGRGMNRNQPTTDERPPIEWLNAVTFAGAARIEPPEEGVFLRSHEASGGSSGSHFRWAWVWFPQENPVNHGVHFEYHNVYWVLRVWGPNWHGGKLTLPRKPTNEEVLQLLRVVWGDIYGPGN